MSHFAWVMLAIAVFISGQWMMMRPSAHEQRLMRLREAARKMGIQARLLPAPDWLKPRLSGMVACYAVLVPEARLPYCRAECRDGQWQAVSGADVLRGQPLPAQAARLLAVEAQANSICWYWREEGDEADLAVLRDWLLAAARQPLSQ